MRAFLAQRGIGTALDDAENFLPVGARLFAAFARPADGAFDGEALFLGGRVVRRTFVENHRDVRAERALDFHRLLRAEEQQRAVKVRTEFDAVRLDFPDFGEAENLEAAAVGENRLFPIHELVQAAGGADDFESGPDIEVVGVAEDDLRAHLQQFARVERLDAGLRADGHEHRRVHDAVRGGQFSEARFGRRIGFEQFKHRAAKLSDANETSTSRSAAIFSRSIFSAARSQRSGNCRRAVALNNVSPDIGALTTSLENSSTFTPARASALVISRTMPGRSWPTISSLDCRPGAAGTGLEPDWTTTFRPGIFWSASSSADLFSAGISISQDAGEFAAEPAHAAFEPVAAVAGHGARDGFDQPGAVRADEGHHQGNLHAGLLTLSPFRWQGISARWPSVAMNLGIRVTEIFVILSFIAFFSFQFRLFVLNLGKTKN